VDTATVQVENRDTGEHPIDPSESPGSELGIGKPARSWGVAKTLIPLNARGSQSRPFSSF
jgi:hypothetical protein